MEIPEYGKRVMPTSALVDFAAPVGQVVLNFALVDHALDFLLMETFDLGKQANADGKMPHLLGDKISQLRKIFAGVRSLKKFERELLPPLKILEDCNVARNRVTHAAISHYEEQPEPTIFFARIKYDKSAGVHFARDEPLSLNEIMSANLSVSDAVSKLQDLFRRISARERKVSR